jgi:hypothetical protein
VATLAALLVYVVALAVFVWLLQLAVFAYGRGVVRSALDEGARVGSQVTDSVGRCQERAEQTMNGLLRGTMGSGVVVSCSDDGERVLAHADVRFAAWAPGMPDWTFDITATSRRATAP